MDKKLQYQLMGAAIIFSLAIIFLPMILRGDAKLERQVQTPPIPLPPVEHFEPLPEVSEFVAFESVQLPEIAEIENLDEIIASDENELPEKESAEPNLAESQASKVKDTEFTVPESSNVSAAEGELASWVVQIASFSEKSKATQLQAKLREGGFDTFVESGTVDKKNVFRVKVGPIAKKSDAEEAQQVIAKSYTLSGMVISYP